MLKKFLSFLGIFSFMSLTFGFYFQPAVSAQTIFNVNSTVDAVDANPGDGACETAVGNGTCTLRAAIQETNALAGNDEINLPAGNYNLTIPGQNEEQSQTGDFDVLGGLKIAGEGQNVTVVSGSGLDRVFEVNTSEDVEFKGLTIRDGVIPASQSRPGGGIYKHGLGNLYVFQSTITNNRVTQDPYTFSMGGGIYSFYGELIIRESTIANNRVESQKWAQGAGIYVYRSDFILERSLVKNNTVQSPSSAGGGGIYVIYGKTNKIVNSTIANNSAPYGNGGGMYFVYATGSQTDIINSTFVGNSSLVISQNSFGYGLGENYTVRIVNSIFADGGNVNFPGFISLGHNICNSSCGLTGEGDLINADPLFGDWDYSGTTASRSLLRNSPAINYADQSQCPETDQRGIARPQGSGCDIGAYELELFNEPPTANAGLDKTVNEGNAVTLNGTGSTDPDGNEDIISYNWDFGDGNTGSGAILNHTYLNNGVYTATLTVTDTAGETSTDTATITVNNVAPIINSIGSIEPVLPGIQINTNASFSDAGVLDTHTATWNWGDGNSSAGVVSETNGSGTVTGNHTYSSPGVYTVTLTVNDGTDIGSQTLTITILTASQTINNLVDLVETFNLQQGINNSLDAKLDAALNALGDINENNNQAAINSLYAFINSVEAQRGNQITNSQADALISVANGIITTLSS